MSETIVGKIEQLTFKKKILGAIDPTRIIIKNYIIEIQQLKNKVKSLERELDQLRRI